LRFKELLLLLLLCVAISPAAWSNSDEPDEGYLIRPPVFLTDEPDVPLTTFAASVPVPGHLTLCSSASSPESDGFAQNGADVQPSLKLSRIGLAAGVMRGMGRGSAVGVLVPASWVRVRSGIGGLPATGDTYGLGGAILFAKKTLRSGRNGSLVVGSLGLELPTGEDDATFDQSNAVTNAYYANSPRRMPLTWQPSNGATNFHLVLSFGRALRRVSYQGILAYKLNGAGDEDVRLGNVIVGALSATYGLSPGIAGSLEVVLRSQGDDSYPNAPPPGVNQPALAGTTTHGTSLSINPSIRCSLGTRLTIGLGARLSVIKPNDGMVPRTRVFLILYPNF